MLITRCIESSIPSKWSFSKPCCRRRTMVLLEAFVQVFISGFCYHIQTVIHDFSNISLLIFTFCYTLCYTILLITARAFHSTWSIWILLKYALKFIVIFTTIINLIVSKKVNVTTHLEFLRRIWIVIIPFHWT